MSVTAPPLLVCYFPRGWRHFIAWMGSVPATSASFKRILKKGSVAVIAGGIAEVQTKSCMQPWNMIVLE